MKIITIARKPFEGSTTANVVENQAGALNIDACRIGYANKSDLDKTKGKNPGRKDLVTSGVYGENRPQQRVAESGRWPSNVLLAHLPECCIVGQRKVRTGTAHRERSGGKTIFSETDKKPLPNMSYAGEDGMETIPAWDCAPGCPVAVLDAQSGELTSGTGAVKRSSSKDAQGNRAFAYGAESRPSGTPVVCHGDSGGASRFFKQLGGRDQSE